MSGKRVGIVGATGLIGLKVLEVLTERQFPLCSLRLFSTARSAGSQIEVCGEHVLVEEATSEAMRGLDLCFFAATAEAARELAPAAISAGAVVIDKSSAFRSDLSVPLVVPEVNAHALEQHRGIVASPNCSTIQLVTVLKPIEEAFGVERVIVSSYQSVSGTGRDAMHELRQQSEAVLNGGPVIREVYDEQIAFNLLPVIDALGSDAYSGEEWKLVNETRRILERPDLAVSATCVRVPVFVGHSEAVLVETRDLASPDEVARILSLAPSVHVTDSLESPCDPMPYAAEGSDSVFVGRIRRDLSSPNGVWMWVVADNLRKGAATNAVQIAEELVKRRLL